MSEKAPILVHSYAELLELMKQHFDKIGNPRCPICRHDGFAFIGVSAPLIFDFTPGKLKLEGKVRADVACRKCSYMMSFLLEELGIVPGKKP